MSVISETGRIRQQASHAWLKTRARFPFGASVALLSSGAILGHILTIAAMPILTRMYVPADMGRLGLFNAFLAVAMVATALQYDAAVVSSSDLREASHLVFLGTAAIVPISVTSGSLLLLMTKLSILGFGDLPVYAGWLMALCLSLAGLGSVLRYWTLRQEKFALASQAVVLQGAGRSAVQLGFGIAGGHTFGLLAGEVLGRGLGMGRMLSEAWPVVRRHQTGKRELQAVAWKYRQFPLYSVPSSMLNMAGTSLPLPLLVAIYGVQAGGYYSLVWRVLALPMALIGVSVADAFHSKAAVYAREEPKRLPRFFHRTSASLAVIALGPALMLLLFGPQLFAFVFGHTWAISGQIAVLVTPWFLTSFVVSPLSRMVFVLDGQRLKLIYDVLIIGGNVLVFLVARMRSWPLTETIVVLSAVNTLAKVTYYFILLRIVIRGGHSKTILQPAQAT